MYEIIRKLVVAFSGTVITYAFGGWNDALGLLALLSILDWCTGISASAYEGYKSPNDKTKGLNSNRGFWGIFKKALMFTIIALMYRFDLVLGLTSGLGFMIGATYFYILNELISLAENLGRLGVKLPSQINMIISVLSSKSEKHPSIEPTSPPVLTIVPEPKTESEDVKEETETTA